MYDDRRCIVCGTVFKPLKPWEVVCCEKCRVERRREVKRVSVRKYREKAKIRLIQLQQDLAAALQRIVELEAELEELKNPDLVRHEIHDDHVNVVVRDEQGEVVDSIRMERNDNLTMQQCERMKLLALTLPCGQRKECFKPSRCTKCPEDAIEDEAIDPTDDISSLHTCPVCKKQFKRQFSIQKYCCRNCADKAKLYKASGVK